MLRTEIHLTKKSKQILEYQIKHNLFEECTNYSYRIPGGNELVMYYGFDSFASAKTPIFINKQLNNVYFTPNDMFLQALINAPSNEWYDYPELFISDDDVYKMYDPESYCNSTGSIEIKSGDETIPIRRTYALFSKERRYGMDFVLNINGVDIAVSADIDKLHVGGTLYKEELKNDKRER